MGVIRQLPPSVVNQIAAGEVVERPASVVKELLENAIDAGATRVDVSVERGGKDLVRIADNGVGDVLGRPAARLPAPRDQQAGRGRGPVPGADAGLPGRGPGGHRRGFQGAVPDPPGRRRRRAPRSRSKPGIAGPIRSCGCPPGTVMEVRNLFFNTPVRRTFLKSDTTEAGHVAETFARIALAHPEVHLTFRSGGKIVHDLPPVTGCASGSPSSLAASWPNRCSGSRAGSTSSTSGAMSPTRRRAGRAPRDSSFSSGAGTSATARWAMPWARPIAVS